MRVVGVRVSAIVAGVGWPGLLLALMLPPWIGACAQRSERVQIRPPAPIAAAPRGGDPANFPPSVYGAASPRFAVEGEQVAKGGGVYKLGSPYQVAGRWYFPRLEPGYDREGMASWYGTDFHGRRTANGEIYDMFALTAAHQTLPLPSLVTVTSLDTGRTVLVRVNDRGPYAHGRVVDLSREAARALGIERQGTGRVRVRYAGTARLDGNDHQERQFLARQLWNRGGHVVSAQIGSPSGMGAGSHLRPAGSGGWPLPPQPLPLPAAGLGSWSALEYRAHR